MGFKRAVQRYSKTPEPVTPYQRAGQLWDERIGSARVQARNWRLMAFGTLALAAGVSAALVWQSTRGRVVPYVVEVDRLGQVQAVAPADASYRPTDPQFAWHLARFVSNVRSRSLDPVVMRESWLSAYDFATQRAAIFLGEYARGSKPFAEVGRRTVSVQVTSVVRASDDSFQVKWTETAYERGSIAGSSRWTAILTVVVRPPRSADALRKNPLGLYVDAIDWARELETSGDRPTGTRPPSLPASQPPPHAPPSSATAPPEPDFAPASPSRALERNDR